MTRKLIVTNRSVLTAKYGQDLFRIDNALNHLISADAARGITTEVVNLDDAAQMQTYGAAPVTNAADERENKEAVDAACAQPPDYLMIFGAPDVVPHQALLNTAPDADPDVPSDLPYACTHGYGRTADEFVGPTRVVSRLPDLRGVGDAGYPVGLLKTAADHTSRPPSDYDDCFGLSAKAWESSTNSSLAALFPARTIGTLTSPTSGPNHSAPDLHKSVHFINCHGAPGSPMFIGDPGSPVAHDAALLAGQLREGAILAAECCYGAELY